MLEEGMYGRLALLVGCPLHAHDGLVVRPEAVEGRAERFLLSHTFTLPSAAPALHDTTIEAENAGAVCACPCTEQNHQQGLELLLTADFAASAGLRPFMDMQACPMLRYLSACLMYLIISTGYLCKSSEQIATYQWQCLKLRHIVRAQILVQP